MLVVFNSELSLGIGAQNQKWHGLLRTYFCLRHSTTQCWIIGATLREGDRHQIYLIFVAGWFIYQRMYVILCVTTCTSNVLSNSYEIDVILYCFFCFVFLVCPRYFPVILERQAPSLMFPCSFLTLAMHLGVLTGTVALQDSR